MKRSVEMCSGSLQPCNTPCAPSEQAAMPRVAPAPVIGARVPPVQTLVPPAASLSVSCSTTRSHTMRDDGFPTLVEMVNCMWYEMYGDRAQLSLTQMIDIFCFELGIERKGSFTSQARACYAQLLPSAQPVQPVVRAVPDLRMNLAGVSKAERRLPDLMSGPSLTERSERSHSNRESPPKLVFRLPARPVTTGEVIHL